MSGPINPLQVFAEDLFDQNLRVRLDAMGKLSTVSLAMGASDTRSKLLPYLQERIICFSDDLLYILADQLVNFLPFIGGPQYADCLFPILEDLCLNPEPLVHERASESLSQIIRYLSPNQAISSALPLLRRLATFEGFHHPRCAAPRLMKTLYPILPPQERQDLLTLLGQLISDSTSLVRRATLTACPYIVPHLDESAAAAFCQPLGPRVEDEDALTRESLALCLITSLKLAAEARIAYITPPLFAILKKMFFDKAWVVRLAIAYNLDQLIASLDAEMIQSTLVSLFCTLLTDAEMVVRYNTAQFTLDICNNLRPQTITRYVMPTAMKLITDPAPPVRAAICEGLFEVATKIDHTFVTSKLLPKLNKLFRDPNNRVRMLATSKIMFLLMAVGKEAATHEILSVLVSNLSDANYSVRMAALEQLPFVFICVSQDLFTEKFLPSIFQALSDHAHMVRITASFVLALIIPVLPNSIINEVILSKLLTIAASDSYLVRIAALRSYRYLIHPPSALVEFKLGHILNGVSNNLTKLVDRYQLSMCSILHKFNVAKQFCDCVGDRFANVQTDIPLYFDCNVLHDAIDLISQKDLRKNNVRQMDITDYYRVKEFFQFKLPDQVNFVFTAIPRLLNDQLPNVRAAALETCSEIKRNSGGNLLNSSEITAALQSLANDTDNIVSENLRVYNSL
eukprot:TRINITY_DN3160_c2_g1_i11.p1 TRINITY_DN3160_c2_g1~~TRINITY_DN3160_c2_g1_i11.p1  ORF type:complete len:692 (-),score=124.24 TRINITY_DN3160_c2_g1_i11:105-2153(-)